MAVAVPRLSWIPRIRLERRVVLYGIYTLFLFLVFLVLTFPHEVVVGRYAEQFGAESGWTVRYGSVSLVPWAGYRATDFEVFPPDSPEPWLRASRFDVRPSVGALFRGDLSTVTFHADAYGGEIRGRLSRTKPAALDLEWSDLDFASYTPLTQLVTGTWSGELSGEVHLSSEGTLAEAKGPGKIRVESFSLTGGDVRGFKIPELHFDRGEGEVEVNGPRVEVKSLKLSGRQVDGEIRGNVFLKRPLGQSVITAGTMTVRPIPGAGADIDALLTLLNRNQKPPGGTFNYALYGTLLRPRVR